MRTPWIAAALLCAASAQAHETQDQPEGPARLHVGHAEGMGEYLVDQAGRSLYLFEADKEAGGAPVGSACTGTCGTTWPPVITEGEPEAHDDLDAGLLGTLTREDGDLQVTYGGWPLYYFSADMMPGHARGQDVEMDGGEWYLVAPSGDPVGEAG